MSQGTGPMPGAEGGEEASVPAADGDFDPMTALLGEGGDSAVEVDLSDSSENPKEEG